MKRKQNTWKQTKEEKLNFSGTKKLRDWKDNGSIVIWLHTKSGITARLIHLVPYVDKDDNEKKVIRYFPFTCHEDPKVYYQQDEAQNCPIDRAIDLLAEDGRVDDDDIVWDASIGNNKKDRIYTKLDFCGLEGGEWRNSMKPRFQWVFVVVDDEHVDEGLRVAAEARTLGDAIKECISNEIDSQGDDLGDPDENPYAFKLVYDKDAKKATDYYKAYSYRRAKLTDEIQDLLASPTVDVGNYIDPGNSIRLREIFEAHFKADLDLDMLFDNIQDPDREDNASPEEDVEEVEPEKKTKSGKKGKSKKKEPEPEKVEQPTADREICELCNGTGKVGKRKAECPDCEGVGYFAIEITEQEVCETCEGVGTIGKKKAKCPDCDGSGLVNPEDAPDPEPEPEPKPKKKPPKKSGKKGGKKGKGKKNEPEPEPEEEDIQSNTTCGGCKKQIPDDATVCPYCGAEFGDDDE